MGIQCGKLTIPYNNYVIKSTMYSMDKSSYLEMRCAFCNKYITSKAEAGPHTYYYVRATGGFYCGECFDWSALRLDDSNKSVTASNDLESLDASIPDEMKAQLYKLWNARGMRLYNIK